ncbi:hypothetical protein J7K92_01460 [bacterium]|nr:hypothetical protein [bacterium]
MPQKPTNSVIPKRAIRTMQKDLAGMVYSDLENPITESEILEIIKKYKEKTSPAPQKKEAEQEIEEIKKSLLGQKKTEGPIREVLQKEEERKRMEELRRKKKEELRKSLEEKRRKLEEEQRKKMEEEKRRKIEEERKRKEEERKRKEKEKKKVEEIRKRALERKKMTELEMKKLWLERKKREEEQKRKLKEKTYEQRLLERRAQLLKALDRIPEEKKPLDKEKNYLIKEREKIINLLEPVIESEKRIEENIHLIEKREVGFGIPEEKRRAEQERQLAEMEREKIEKERWELEKQLFQIDEKLKDLEFRYKNLIAKETKLKQEIEDVKKELEKIEKKRLAQQKEKEVKKIQKEKESVLVQKDKVINKRRSIEEEIAELRHQEEKVEQEIAFLEAEEKVARKIERQKIEQQRMKLEKKRARIERKRWALEDSRRKFILEENRLNVKHQNYLERENALRKEIDGIYQFLGLVSSSKQSPPTVAGPKWHREKSNTFPKKSLSKTGAEEPPTPSKKPFGEIKPKPKTTPLPKETPAKPIGKLEEKREEKELLKKIEKQKKEEEKRKEEEFLKRIRAGLERKIQKPTEALQDRPIPTASQPHIPQSENVPSLKRKFDISSIAKNLQPLPTPNSKKKFRFGKIVSNKWVKIAFVIIGITLTVFAALKIIRGRSKNPMPSPPTPTAPASPSIEETTPSSESSPPSSQTLTPQAPTPIIPLSSSTTLEIQDAIEIPQLLNNLYLTDYQENKFIGVLFYHKTQNKYLNGKEMLNGLAINLEKVFYDAFEEYSTLFLYRENKEHPYRSVGFVFKKKEGNTLDEALPAWNKNVIPLSQTLAIILGEQYIPANIQIKTVKYHNTTLNYFDISSKKCLGGCYATVNNKYFVFATCCNPVIKLIDLLSQ